MSSRVRFALAMTTLMACGGTVDAGPAGPAESAPASGCADVVDVAVTGTGGSYRFDVTVRSSDTGWDKYADSWEVRGSGGEALATRVLTHPHENEQPFTRSLAGVEVAAGTTVEVWAHDSVDGYCGAWLALTLP
jgi:hypothetical protein